MLLEKGADPNIPNDLGEPPIYWASANDNKEIEKLLLKYIDAFGHF